MRYWLFKSEPCTWSWNEQVKAGATGTGWTGVRNHLAKQQMMAMQKGDHGFFYHSNEGKAMVGIVQVVKEYHPDPTDEKGQFGMVAVKAVKPLPKPVTLAEVKATPALAGMALVTSARLSVQPVTEVEWRTILAMAGLSPRG